VYARVGGHAYESVYPGPIGAILTPQLVGMGDARGDSGSGASASGGLGSEENARSLPYASSLCGACGEVCPVKIEIPRLLTHLRAREVASRGRLDPEKLTMRALFHTLSRRDRYERAQKIARTAARPFARGGGSAREDGGTGGGSPRTIRRAPGPLAGWTTSRDLPAPAPETFREWWRRTREPAGTGREAPAARTLSTLTPHIGPKLETIPGPGRAGGPAGGGRDARADVLDRIRSALAGASKSDIPRNYRTEDERDRDAIVNEFAERVAEYRATVHRVRENEVAEVVERIAAEAGAARIGIPSDLLDAWRPSHARALELVVDDSLSVPEVDRLDGALTGCALGVAQVGAFVLDGGAGQGRRALSLVPDLHICVVREDQVVGLVPEAVRRLEESVGEGRPLTFVAGPSATSDIELDRVEGVHGPRVLHVLLVAT
jgi:L-lactate utilization protein LutC